MFSKRKTLIRKVSDISTINEWIMLRQRINMSLTYLCIWSWLPNLKVTMIYAVTRGECPSDFPHGHFRHEALVLDLLTLLFEWKWFC